MEICKSGPGFSVLFFPDAFLIITLSGALRQALCVRLHRAWIRPIRLCLKDGLVGYYTNQ